tara:strand:+ start:528 stop:692 length:165 start_codon:yes stop_codon:yes gene_type:complete
MRVHIPAKNDKLLDKAISDLYLLKEAVDHAKPEVLKERINNIRKTLLKFKESDT